MKIRFATYNLFQFVQPPYSWYTKKDKFSAYKWIEKLEWVKNQIIALDADIIVFQEVFSKDVLENLCKELGYEYFLTVDDAKLKDENSRVYTSMTVALASRFPISKVHKIKKDKSFTFSRIPIKAQIKLPNNQDILVYAAHLKSNRTNEFEYLFKKDDTFEYKKELTDKALKQGFSNSLKLRLQEASSLFSDVKESLDLPIVLMCDLNDKEFSMTIDALSNKAYHKNRKNSSYILYDAYYLFDQIIDNPHPEQKEIKRTATSYYQGHGNILDYIFISKHFNKNNKNAIAKISSYEVHDKHLQDNQNGDIVKSDHAQIVCELEFI